MDKERYIVHVDMDAFFASIEQRDNPSLRGLPVIVGADPKKGKGRGVVSTCSYEARKFGVHSAMPVSIAYKKCPQAVFLPVDMEKYGLASGQIYTILNDFTPDVEPISIDEAFLDITGSWHLFESPLNTCKLIKARIKKEAGLIASIGLGPIKMVAKIASDLNKPDGLVVVTREGLLDFLWPLQIDKIWGLGEKTKIVLNEMGIRTIADLAKRDKEELISVLGKNGEHFWLMAWGKDEREIESARQAKSISNEITFYQDTQDKEKIEAALLSLCEKVSSRLRQEGFKGKAISLKIRLQGFVTYTRANTLDEATNFADVIYCQIKKLYQDFKTKAKAKVRLVGVRVSGLIPSDFPDALFKDEAYERREKIHTALDKIKEKFGDRVIYRAAGIKQNRRQKI